MRTINENDCFTHYFIEYSHQYPTFPVTDQRQTRLFTTTVTFSSVYKPTSSMYVNPVNGVVEYRGHSLNTLDVAAMASIDFYGIELLESHSI